MTSDDVTEGESARPRVRVETSVALGMWPIQHTPIPPLLHRVLDDPEHARRFVEGEEILVTTLQRCRDRERDDSMRHDARDGVFTNAYPIPNSQDPVNHITYWNNTKEDEHVLPNAWVLCTMVPPAPAEDAARFGGSTVVISNPLAFARALNQSLARSRRELVGRYEVGGVFYGPTKIDARTLQPPPLGFVKEPTFGWQREFRLLHRSNSAVIDPVLLHVPEAPLYCTLAASSDSTTSEHGRILRGRHLKGMVLDLDLVELHDCIIEDCVLCFAGYSTPRAVGCELRGTVEYRFEERAFDVLSILEGMSRSEGGRALDSLFESVRQAVKRYREYHEGLRAKR